MPKVKENCGVVGIYSLSGKNVVPMVFDAYVHYNIEDKKPGDLQFQINLRSKK